MTREEVPGMEQKTRFLRIDTIRALAILMVVFGHSIILYQPSWQLYSTQIQAPILEALKTRLLDLIQMPLFFSLSGFLFLNIHRKGTGFLSMLGRKARRLLVPYLFVFLFYLLPLRLLIRYPGYSGLGVKELLSCFLTASDVGHLWFLPALFFVFLFAYCILWAVEKIPGIRNRSDLLLLLVSAVIYFEGYRFVPHYPPLQTAALYLMWFSLGYCIHCFQDLVGRIYRNRWLSAVLLSLNCALLLAVLLPERSRVLFSLGFQGLTILNLYGMIPDRCCKSVRAISRNSFGIYLFHSPLIYLTAAFCPNLHPVLMVLINFLAFGTVAYGITVLLRKTPFRFVIGE